MKIIFSIFFLIMHFMAFCQTDVDGAWDKARASTREITLQAGNRTWVGIEFPIGTTEIALRITLLEKNQQLTSSFAEVLGNIPDVHSQLASASVTLLSSIAGDDKCKYFIFQDHNEANNFITYGTFAASCYANPSPVTKDVVFLKNYCFAENMQTLYFAFQNTNAFMEERIILETVPWVDRNLSRGWTKSIKDNFVTQCVGGVGNQYANPRAVCQCALSKFESTYKAQDLGNLGAAEIEKVAQTFLSECLKETGEDDHALNKLRNEAQAFANQRKYGDAISKLLEVINSGEGTWYFYILTKQYLKAIKNLKQGELLDETELMIKGNLAHAYLLNGDIDQAKALYIKYKTQNITDSMGWIDMVKVDFDAFQQQGIACEHFDQILSMLK